MKLIVKNYGAIQYASIDLSKKLYLFVGYNNTGKTYLTKLIYEIFNPDTLSDFSSSEFNTFDNKQEIENLILTKELIDGILKDFSNYLKEEVVAKKLLKVDTDILELDKFHIEFEYDIETIKNSEFKSSSKLNFLGLNMIVFNLIKKKKSLKLEIEQWDEGDFLSKLPKELLESISGLGSVPKEFSSLRDAMDSNTNTYLLLNLLLQIDEKPFFLPSNRDFILENADALKTKVNETTKEIAELALELLGTGDTNKEQISNLLARKLENTQASYIQELSDEILKLRSSKDENFISKGTEFHNELLEKLSKLLGGEIIYEKASAISNSYEKFKLHQGTEKVIKMDLASSSVNQLSPLFLFFKYLAKAERNFLMIDEPEENLHPQNQILLMNLLMEFITNNNRLLITTHSPLLAEVINNYLVLSQLNNKQEIIDKKGLPQIDITAENTGIYYFAGEKVFEHQIQSYGTLFTSFKFAQDDVYDFGNELGDLMFKQLNREYNKG